MPNFGWSEAVRASIRNIFFLVTLSIGLFSFEIVDRAWIRINLLGYKPASIKVAVWCGKDNESLMSFQLVEVSTQKVVFKNDVGMDFGSYGPFSHTYRLDFTAFRHPGTFVLRAGTAESPPFSIGPDVYKGTADFSLQYMRQQRSGYNPYLKDSCHTQDGYTMDGPMPDSTHLDVSGGWHDATDYLQYSMTSANATYHLLAAYRDYPHAFSDRFLANGLAGRNGIADVFDEARWGLDWLLKMHPKPDWMFNQLADDRDHRGFRLPNKDTASYGKGLERPIYFLTGEVQGLGKYKNRTQGTSSTAGKFSSAFSLGYQLMREKDPTYALQLKRRAVSAYAFAQRKLGNSQTASYTAPYFYEEDNWVDDMELAAVQLYNISRDKNYLGVAFDYAGQEPLTPWLGKDTASHYQWYPFINIGHYELGRVAQGEIKDTAVDYYRRGIEAVWAKARHNAFYRGVPFIWCSNNLQTAFAVQCLWYRRLSGDRAFEELEQASFDWLLGCNPWGTSMIVGLPEMRDFPDDPHSSFNVLYGYQTLGGLVDGPVYGSIYNKQLGVTIVHGDEYAEFQSDHVVYHDDYGDYVTNEPTMDGTANLIYLLAAKESEVGMIRKTKKYDHGAVIRGDRSSRNIALVFTGDGYANGGDVITRTLEADNIKASFFLTGNFYRNPAFKPLIRKLKSGRHYLGAHSDKHLLYCSWENRDSLLVTRDEFEQDLLANYAEMKQFGIKRGQARYFLPPYEWYNDTIAAWTKAMGLQLINYSPGTISHADYTTPDMNNYRSSDEIFQSIHRVADELNGFILLVHLGADPKRDDPFFNKLPELIKYLKTTGYEFVTIDKLLSD